MESRRGVKARNLLWLGPAICLAAWSVWVTFGPNCSHSGPGLRRSYALNVVSNFVTALESYRDRWDGYPPDEDGAAETTALVTYLDGDPTNGGPGEIYFSFDPYRLDSGAYLSPWGHPYQYDELESEGRSASGDPAGPPGNKVNIHSFDLWTEDPDEPPERWITNYRDPWE